MLMKTWNFLNTKYIAAIENTLPYINRRNNQRPAIQQCLFATKWIINNFSPTFTGTGEQLPLRIPFLQGPF